MLVEMVLFDRRGLAAGVTHGLGCEGSLELLVQAGNSSGPGLDYPPPPLFYDWLWH